MPAMRRPEPRLDDGRSCVQKKRLRGVVKTSCTRCGAKSQIEGSELLKRRPARCAVGFCGGVLVALLTSAGRPETVEQVEAAFG